MLILVLAFASVLLVKGTTKENVLASFLVTNNLGQLNLESFDKSRVLADGLSTLTAFDYIYSANLIFYLVDHQLKHNEFISAIKAINLTSHQIHNVYTAEHGTINALTIDWHNMMAYWADFKEEVISVGEINLSSMLITKYKLLFSSKLRHLKSLCVDPISRSIFWLKSGESTQIESAGLDGSGRAVLFDKPNSAGRDLNIDIFTRRLLWLDETQNRITSIDFSGGDIRQFHILDSNNKKVQFLTAFDGKMYFFRDMSIVSAPFKEVNWSTAQVHLSINYQPSGFKVFSQKEQPRIEVRGDFPCVPERFRQLTNTGETGCNFLCLSSPIKPHYNCSCPTGVPSNQPYSSSFDRTESSINLVDTRICPKNPEKFLLVARPPKIFMLSLGDRHVDSHLWPIGGSPYPRGNLVRVDFDPKSLCIYWVDNVIYRLKLGEKNPTTVIEPANGAIQMLDGLAVDWIAGNLYWSTGGNKQIWVSHLNGAWPRLLLTLEVSFDNIDTDSIESGIPLKPHEEEANKRRPTALVIDPINRYLFFNVWSGTRGRIERTWLDGTHRQIVVDQNHTVWPNGIALDFESRHLYYVDAYLGVINRVDYDGGEPKQIVAGHLQHPFGFDILGDNLYWSDWQTLSISQVNKHNGEDLRVLKTIGVDEALMGIRAVDLTLKDTYKTNICGNKVKSGCSHLCFVLPVHGASTLNSTSVEEMDLYYCACPPEYALDSDGKTCIVPDFMLLYSLDGTGLRRMSLPKSRLRHYAFQTDPTSRQSSDTAPGDRALTNFLEIELAAAETAAMVSNQIFNQVPLPFLRRVIRFDVHISEERIYWVEDSAPQCISVAFLNGTGKEILLCLFHDMGSPEVNQTADQSFSSSTSSSENQHQTRDSIVGLALDWLTNALYFCVDGERPRLEVVDLKYRNYLPLYAPTSVYPSSHRRPRKTFPRSNWYSARMKRNIVPSWFLHQQTMNVDLPSDDYSFQAYDFNPVMDRLANTVDNYRLVLLQNLSSPRDLVVHPRKRLLFWLDGTHNARFNIFSAGLDGRHHRLLWNGVGMVMSLAIDYATDRLYWMNWVTKCIESISLNGEDWFAVNPLLPPDRSAQQSSTTTDENGESYPSNAAPSSGDFHPYAIDAFQGTVLFSELTTQSVYRVQIPILKSGFTIGSQLNLPADLLLRGPSSASAGYNFLVLGLFLAGFNRQAPEPDHRCAPPTSSLSPHPSNLMWSYQYGPQNLPQQPQLHHTGPICQALCLGAPPPHSHLGNRGSGSSSTQASVFRGRGVASGYPASILDDRSPQFTCACPTQFTLASDAYSCLEPQRSLLIINADGSITRYTPDDQPATNLLSLSPLSLPRHDQLSLDGANSSPSWHLGDQAQAYPNGDLPGGDADLHTDHLDFARRWAVNHRVAATALDELTNSGVFFLLQPVNHGETSTSPSPPPSRGRSFRQGTGRRPGGGGGGRHNNKFSQFDSVAGGASFMRLGFLEFSTGEVTLWEGGPLVPSPDLSESHAASSNKPLNRQRRHLKTQSRPRWTLSFDPVNQILFWSDAITGLIGAENSKTGRTIGLVANLSETARTVLEIVVEPRSGQIFQLTANWKNPLNVPSHCRVEMTYLDGSERRVLHDLSTQPGCPHSLTYSAKLTQLFWVDPVNRQIQSLNVANGIGSGLAKPVTVVMNALPSPKSLVVLPKSTRTMLPSAGTSLWLMWLEPIRSSVSSNRKDHFVRLLYVPLDTPFISGALTPRQRPLPAPPPGLHSYVWNSENGLFLLPVRGGGLGDLSWHPCAGPSHGECSQFCLPKLTASSPSLPLYPGPLTPHPPLSSPQPQSLWRTVRRCACAIGSHLLTTGAQGDEVTICSRIPYCLPPNLLCLTGLTSYDQGVRGVSSDGYYLIGGPFPKRGVCIPAHKVCDGQVDCKDGIDETNCPQTCPEYECNNGRCLPFSSRCNDVIECDSDESCCGKDQFECRRPRSSLALYQHSTHSSLGRCLPQEFVCNGRPDCPDGWDEASCDTGNQASNVGDAGLSNRSTVAVAAIVADNVGKALGEFPSIYTVVIVSAILVVVVVFGLITYMCSKRWSKSYTVHAEQLDVLLIPTDKDVTADRKPAVDKDESNCLDNQRKRRNDYHEPRIAQTAIIKATTTVTEHASTNASRRCRQSGVGSSRKVTSKVTVSSPTPANGTSSWYCPSCSPRESQSPQKTSRNSCKHCIRQAQKHSKTHKLNFRSNTLCRCGASLNESGALDNSSSGVYWAGAPSKCPPAPPPSSLPSPPPSPTANSCLFEELRMSSPPAPPPSKLHDNDDETGDRGTTSDFSESSSGTASPHFCRHFHHRQRTKCRFRRHRRRLPRHTEASVSSTVSTDYHNHYRYISRQNKKSNTKRSGRKVSFRTDLKENVQPVCSHCPQCGSKREQQIARRKTFIPSDTAVEQHSTAATLINRESSATTNTVGSSVSSSSDQKTYSHGLSDYYPRETVNPPPSPIAESTYASLPVTVLKAPNIIPLNASLSNSSGSSGRVCNNGLRPLSIETLGPDKELDQLIITTVGNLGRSGTDSPKAPHGDVIFNIPKQIQMSPPAARCIATSPSCRHRHHDRRNYELSHVGVTSAAAALTTTTTTTIQNVHVVILTSNKENRVQRRNSCVDCSPYSSDEGECARGASRNQLALTHGRIESSPLGLFAMPSEPREQAEGAESQELNLNARAPFAQFSLPGNNS